jgi:hypothetical protein
VRVPDTKVKGGALKPGSIALVACAAGACCAISLALAARHLGDPGLYYDEVIQAGPALEFLRDDGEPFRFPGARSARVFERWLPWMTQPYMGALKSQLLIPVFAAADASAELLRGTTLVWALLGIPLAMLFANRALGLAVALLTGALLAVDPALLFLARHDWGSFSLGFLLRCAALLLVYGGWRDGAAGRIALGAACLGLGVYNKIDFGVFVAAAALALAIAAPDGFWRELRERRRRVLAFAAGFGIGIAPLLLAAGGALSVTGAAARGAAPPGGWSEKWTVMGSVLEGSYFQRLILAGGRFEDLASVAEATRGLGSEVFLAAALATCVLLGSRRSLRRGEPGVVFVLATALLTLLGIFLTPRAVRAHHFLNVQPFPQLVIACAVVLLWTRTGGMTRAPARALALLLVSVALFSAVRIDVHTLHTLRDTGGRGRWSDALGSLLRELPPEARVVSLDWGFDGPIRFMAPALAEAEPIWRLRSIGPTRLEGGPEHVYLVYEPEYAVFAYGAALQRATSRLPAGAVQVERRRDREGNAVFRVIRFASDHALVYRGGRFEVEIE